MPEAEQKAAAQRERKAKTDVVSECATAILALMLARYPSMDRFTRWYREQIARIEAGELSVPARLVYTDDQLDLPRKPGPDAVSVEALHWHTSSVRLELTIWRPYEFSQRRYTDWIQQTAPGTQERKQAATAQHDWKQQRANMGIHADLPAYFIEVHPTEAMPWFIGPVADWHARLGLGQRQNGGPSNTGIGTGHAGVGTPEEWLVSHLSQVIASDRRNGRRTPTVGVCFDPEATYRGVLFGTAAVTLVPVTNRLLRLLVGSDSRQLSERYSQDSVQPPDVHEHLVPAHVSWRQAHHVDPLTKAERRRGALGNTFRLKRKLQMPFQVAEPAKSLFFGVVCVRDNFEGKALIKVVVV